MTIRASHLRCLPFYFFIVFHNMMHLFEYNVYTRHPIVLVAKQLLSLFIGEVQARDLYLRWFIFALDDGSSA